MSLVAEDYTFNFNNNLSSTAIGLHLCRRLEQFEPEPRV